MSPDQLACALLVGILLAVEAAPALAGWYSLNTAIFLVASNIAIGLMLWAWPVLTHL